MYVNEIFSDVDTIFLLNYILMLNKVSDAA